MEKEHAQAGEGAFRAPNRTTSNAPRDASRAESLSLARKRYWEVSQKKIRIETITEEEKQRAPGLLKISAITVRGQKRAEPARGVFSKKKSPKKKESLPQKTLKNNQFKQ